MAKSLLIPASGGRIPHVGITDSSEKRTNDISSKGMARIIIRSTKIRDQFLSYGWISVNCSARTCVIFVWPLV